MEKIIMFIEVTDEDNIKLHVNVDKIIYIISVNIDNGCKCKLQFIDQRFLYIKETREDFIKKVVEQQWLTIT